MTGSIGRVVLGESRGTHERNFQTGALASVAISVESVDSTMRSMTPEWRAASAV
jgi:hypothetical protein